MLQVFELFSGKKVVSFWSRLKGYQLYRGKIKPQRAITTSCQDVTTNANDGCIFTIDEWKKNHFTFKYSYDIQCFAILIINLRL